MTRTRIKLALGGLAIASAVVYLGVAATRSSWVYYLDVDHFVLEGVPDGTRVRLHGAVAPEGFAVSAADMVARFDLAGEHSRVRVEYRGAVPSLLAPGREVVVEGAAAGGDFRADVLLTKCGSKYERRGSYPLGDEGQRP